MWQDVLPPEHVTDVGQKLSGLEKTTLHLLPGAPNVSVPLLGV